MHLHSQVIILCTDVLGQQVYRFGSAVPNTDLRSTKKEGGRWELGKRGEEPKDVDLCGKAGVWAMATMEGAHSP